MVFVKGRKEIKEYLGAEASEYHIDRYILGGLLVEVTAADLETARTIADQKARVEINSKASGSYPYLEIQDPILGIGGRKKIGFAKSAGSNGKFEAVTLDKMIDSMGYRRSILGDRQRFHMPALVYTQDQAQIEPAKFAKHGYSEPFRGRAVAPTQTEAENRAQNDFYRKIRDFLKSKNDAFVMVTDKQTLAGILEVVDEKPGNKVTLEKVFNVYGYKLASKIFDDPDEKEEEHEDVNTVIEHIDSEPIDSEPIDSEPIESVRIDLEPDKSARTDLAPVCARKVIHNWKDNSPIIDVDEDED